MKKKNINLNTIFLELYIAAITAIQIFYMPAHGFFFSKILLKLYNTIISIIVHTIINYRIVLNNFIKHKFKLKKKLVNSFLYDFYEFQYYA